MKTFTSLKFIFLASTALVLSACNSEHHHHDDDHYYDPLPPTLYAFHVIDTYGTNTEFDEETDLAISPYVNRGEFEVFWSMDSDEDYVVELRFNTRPDTNGSRLISSEFCGPGYFCHENQYQYCDYDTSLDIGCENSSGDYQWEYVGDMLDTIPQDAYLIMQVCDDSFFYCEYEARHVSVE